MNECTKFCETCRFAHKTEPADAYMLKCDRDGCLYPDGWNACPCHRTKDDDSIPLAHNSLEWQLKALDWAVAHYTQITEDGITDLEELPVWAEAVRGHMRKVMEMIFGTNVRTVTKSEKQA